MNKAEFDKWAMDMIKKIDYKRIFTYQLPPEDKCSNVVMCYDKRTGKTGVARCHPDDRFNLYWGKAIATARCLGIKVPKISTYKKLCELKNGDRFIFKSVEYLFVGKCYGNNEIAYVIQNINTLRIEEVGTTYYNVKVEMVE